MVFLQLSREWTWLMHANVIGLSRAFGTAFLDKHQQVKYSSYSNRSIVEHYRLWYSDKSLCEWFMRSWDGVCCRTWKCAVNCWVVERADERSQSCNKLVFPSQNLACSKRTHVVSDPTSPVGIFGAVHIRWNLHRWSSLTSPSVSRLGLPQHRTLYEEGNNPQSFVVGSGRQIIVTADVYLSLTWCNKQIGSWHDKREIWLVEKMLVFTAFHRLIARYLTMGNRG